jgi:hypothetical protein
MTDDKKPADAIVVSDSESGSFSLAEFAELGLIAPIADLSKIRAAFNYKQKLLEAILSESDYVYSAEYKEGNRTVSRNVPTLADAKKVAEACGTSYKASPKKSGIVKLAVALGIRAVRTKTLGLPDDPSAHYSYVEYEALHEKTGQSQIGVGWCDRGERSTPLKTHEIIATADTRAYNRAILRLSGFGDVSAEEMNAIGEEQREQRGRDSAENTSPPVVSVVTKPRVPLTLQAASDESVIRASQAWLDAFSQRGGEPLPAAQQSARSFRELRAAARRGNVAAATQMGTLGLRWEGVAQDGPDIESFVVDRETVTTPTAVPADVPSTKPAESWNLSGAGSAKDDEPPTPASVSYNIPRPDPSHETITLAAAKRVSALLLQCFGAADPAREWLKTHAHVPRAAELRANQYDKLMAALTALAAQKTVAKEGS